MADYIKELGTYLSMTYERTSVTLKADTHQFTLPVDMAVPCGLILNELVSNALKHAFPGQQANEIRIGLSPADDRLVLEVADNGIGLPEGFDAKDADSLGLKLVNLFARQLGGSVEYHSEGQGLRVRVVFPMGKGE